MGYGQLYAIYSMRFAHYQAICLDKKAIKVLKSCPILQAQRVLSKNKNSKGGQASGNSGWYKKKMTN